MQSMSYSVIVLIIIYLSEQLVMVIEQYNKVQNQQASNMTQNICQCHCGTRIDLDEQLLEERQIWKQKYLCLQKQVNNDIELLKENIYNECSNLMQKEFTERENSHNKEINQRNNEIKNLHTNLINLQAKLKVLEKESQIQQNRINEIERELVDKSNELKCIKLQSLKNDEEWVNRLQNETNTLRKKLTNSGKDELNRLENENEHLKHKIKQLQKKYQLLIPEVQRLRNTLNKKTEQLQILEKRQDRIVKQNRNQLQSLILEKQQIDKNHSNCRATILKLQNQVQILSQQLQRYRKMKKQIKVEPVYIDRPVEVQKVVEKIVEVEKIIKQYIEPQRENNNEEIKKLKVQINNLLNDIHQLESRHTETISDYQADIKQYQANARQYKEQRINLVNRIEQLNAEIQMMAGNFRNTHSNQGEKIIVHVNKDGTYQKTVEKIPSKNHRKKY